MAVRSVRTCIGIILALFLMAPFYAYAQNVDMSALNTPTATSFNLSVSPQNPAPYTSVVVTPITSSVNISNATISMTANGIKVYQGNAQPVAIPVGAAGIPILISITATDANGPHTQSVTVTPQDVSLVAEPVSSAPVFYLGKPLVPVGGETRVVAVANIRDAKGNELDPSTLSYTWTLDNQLFTANSGIGRSSILVESPLEYRQSVVQVTVQNSDGSLVGSDSLTLVPQEPSVRIYEDDPLLGIRNNAALSGPYAISGSEDSFYAAPFSFATDSNTPVPQWFLNGAGAQNGNLITLRPTGSGSGTANLSVTVPGNQYTSATERLVISFGRSITSNLFGL